MHHCPENASKIFDKEMDKSGDFCPAICREVASNISRPLLLPSVKLSLTIIRNIAYNSIE